MNVKPLNARRLKNINSVLLIQLGDIGDVVLTTPCIRTLRENFPKATVVVAVREKAKELIEDCPWADEVIAINKEKRKLFHQIAYQKDFVQRMRKFRFDLTIDLRTGTRGAILAFLSGARQRIGYYAQDNNLWRNRIFTRLSKIEYDPRQHVAEYYLSLLKFYHLKTKDTRPEIQVPLKRQKMATSMFKKEGILLDRPVIAIQPFSLWQYKEWGGIKFSRLIDWIRTEYGFPVVLIGSPDEKERAAHIMNRCEDGVYSLVGKTSIGTLAAVLKQCFLFIGVDSAGMHMAAALGIPTVSIFGPSSPVSWAPQGNQHSVVHKDMPCVPCRHKGCEDSEISRCLKQLTVEEVTAAVDKRLKT